MAISKRLRYEVLRRDGYKCRYCGLNATETELTVDHVLPSALGGNDDPTNLVACCGPCNSGKSSSTPDAPLVADVAASALIWRQAFQQALDEIASELTDLQFYSGEFLGAWRDFVGAAPLDSDWESTLHHWLGLGVDYSVLENLLRVVAGKRHVSSYKMWRYFCGCVWRTIDRATLAAKKAIDDA